MSFKLDDKIQKSLRLLIIQNGGEIDESSNLIISMISNQNNSRTPIWIERSVEEGKLLDIGGFALYKPLQYNYYSEKKLNICTTGFKKNEYKDIVSTIKWIDGKFNNKLTKNCSNLIAKKYNEESEKIKYAKKWGITICSIDWLINFLNGKTKEELKCFIFYQQNESSQFLSDDDFDDVFQEEEIPIQEKNKPNSDLNEKENQNNDQTEIIHSTSFTNLNNTVINQEEISNNKMKFLDSDSDDDFNEIVETKNNICENITSEQNFLFLDSNSDDDILDILESKTNNIEKGNSKYFPLINNNKKKNINSDNNTISSIENNKRKDKQNLKVIDNISKENITPNISESEEKFSMNKTHNQNCIDLALLKNFTQLPSKENEENDLYEVIYDSTSNDTPYEPIKFHDDPLVSLMKELSSTYKI